MNLSIEIAFPTHLDEKSVKDSVTNITQLMGSPEEGFEWVKGVIRKTWRGKNRPVVKLKFPTSYWEGDLGTFMTMVFGKLNSLGCAKIISVQLPKGAGKKGVFGYSGIKQRLHLENKPILMGVFRPAYGLRAKDYAHHLQLAGEAGIDIVKDDEIIGDLPIAPFLERIYDCRKVLDKLSNEGKQVLYAVNITGPSDTLLQRAKSAVQAGANALMINALSHGLSTVEALTSDPNLSVPVFIHPVMAGALCNSENHGISYSALLGSLFSKTGGDAIMFPSEMHHEFMSVEEEKELIEEVQKNQLLPIFCGLKGAQDIPTLTKKYNSNIGFNIGGIVGKDAIHAIKLYRNAVEQI